MPMTSMRHHITVMGSVLALLLSSTVQAQPPAGDRALSAPVFTFDPVPATGQGRWIAFDRGRGTSILFTAQVQGQPVKALLDTGAGFSIIDTSLSDRLSLTVGDPLIVDGFGRTVAAKTAARVAFKAGSLAAQGLTILSRDLSALSQAVGQRIAIVVGRDILTTGVLEIDFDHARFRFGPTGSVSGTTALPLLFSANRQDILTRLDVGSAKALSLHLDLGFTGQLMLTREAWGRVGLPDAPMTDVIVMGLGGPAVTDLSIMPKINLGALRMDDLETQIEPPSGYATMRGLDGALGVKWFARFNPAFDFHAGRLFLSPRTRPPSPAVRSTSGVQLLPERNRLRVIHVMRNSPAAKARWSAGDLICAIDGQKIAADYGASVQRLWSTGTPGRNIVLTLCDGARRVLRLARFY